MWVKLSIEELLVAVDHNQLPTMASETVDALDWSHPPPYTKQYPLSSTYCTVQFRLQITRLAALSEPQTCDLRNARPTHCLCGHSGYKSDDLVILGVTFDSKMTFEKHLRSVSRAASHRLGSWGNPGECSMIDCFLGDAFWVLFGVLFCSVVLGCRYTT